MNAPWTRDQRIAAIVKERGLSTRGFRRSLRALVAEFVTDADCDEARFQIESDLEPGEQPPSNKDLRDETFEEWFNECHAVPAAFRLRRGDEPERGIHNVTVEVYEVEGTAEISEDKLSYYSQIADGDGPHCELHIIDKYDHELIVESNYLAAYMVVKIYAEHSPNDDKPVPKKEYLKSIRQRAAAQHHAPVVVDEQGAADRKREIATLKRQLARTDHANIAGALQNVIYGLGLGQSHKEIARRAETTPAVVRATARLLAANAVNPKDIVKDTHARWKAAYDAVRELGVQL